MVLGRCATTWLRVTRSQKYLPIICSWPDAVKSTSFVSAPGSPISIHRCVPSKGLSVILAGMIDPKCGWLQGVHTVLRPWREGRGLST
jgi:hypothetical protein